MVNLGSDLNVCPYDTIRLYANNPGMSYYWSNGSVEPSIVVGTTGIGFDLKTIWVRVENEDGCMGTDTVRIAFDFAECTGVDELQQKPEIFLFPNPTKGVVLIEWTGISGKVDLEITDLQGNKVLNQSVMAPPTGVYKGKIDLGGNPKGIYLLRLVGEETVLVEKIILH
jgi:hypothetical protein